MKPLSLSIAGVEGMIFEGDAPGSIAFVPSTMAKNFGGDWLIDTTAYFVSGWAEKNVRFSSADGDRIFPVADEPVGDESDPRVQALIARLEHVYEVVH